MLGVETVPATIPPPPMLEGVPICAPVLPIRLIGLVTPGLPCMPANPVTFCIAAANEPAPAPPIFPNWPVLVFRAFIGLIPATPKALAAAAAAAAAAALDPRPNCPSPSKPCGVDMSEARFPNPGLTFIAAKVFMEVAKLFEAGFAATAALLPITAFILELEFPDGRFPIGNQNVIKHE